MSKQIHIGVRQGSGPAPGYRWGVLLPYPVFREMRFLTAGQRKHLARQVKSLANHDDPTHSDSLSIDQIEDYYELREWRGVLSGLSIRIFFGVDKAKRWLVVLGVFAKKNNGPTPVAMKVRQRRRWRAFRDGDYGEPD